MHLWLEQNISRSSLFRKLVQKKINKHASNGALKWSLQDVFTDVHRVSEICLCVLVISREMFALPPCRFSRPARPPTNSHSQKEGKEKKNVSFLPGWRCWMRMAVGGRQREKNTRRKSSISVWVQYLWPHWLRVKLLSLVQLKQVEAGSSPLQIHQALVSVRLPPIHQVASLSEKKPH